MTETVENLKYSETVKNNPDVANQRVMREKLFRFGEKNYKDYLDPYKLWKENTLMVANSNAQIDVMDIPVSERRRIENFFKTSYDEELTSIFNRQHSNPQSFLDTSKDEGEKITDIYKIIVKDRSFPKVVERQKESGIKLFGDFNKDPDLKDIQVFLPKIFTGGILNKCLISKIVYRPDIVAVSIVKNLPIYDFFLPIEKYKEWKKLMPEIADYKVRCVNFGDWNDNHNFTWQYLSFPVYIFSFNEENIEDFGYLTDISREQKMRVYKIGAITHEVGHNIYCNLMDSEARNEWSKIIKDIKGITKYSERYKTGWYGKTGFQNGEKEEFSEAVRLFTTTPEYLRDKFPVVFNWINKNFPEIKPLKGLKGILNEEKKN